MASAVLTRPTVTVRPITEDDLTEIIPANNAEIPAVSLLDEDKLTTIIDAAETAVVAEVDDEVAGFVFGLPSGLEDFDSANYQWFEDHLDDYVYIERIVVLPGNQGLGIGRTLYDHVVDNSDAPVLVSEVNTNPRNDGSLAFHDRYGFSSIGTMTYGDDIECAKMAKPLD